jgi:hypothetical protein
MNAIAFDTHAHVKRLVGSGLTEVQAEAVIDAVRQTADLPDLSHLATKADLQAVELKLDGRINAVKGELIWWIIGSAAVSTLAHYFIK